MKQMRWWLAGLVGGMVLTLATLVKLIRVIAYGGDAPDGDLFEVAGFAIAIFGMGFLCGVVAWAGRGLSRRFGSVGDAIVGLFVMEVLFVCCMFLFDPAMLGANMNNGLLMLGFGAVAGMFSGVLVGKDLRKSAEHSHTGMRRPFRDSDENHFKDN